MEPLLLIANQIAKLIFSEAFKKGGQKLGKAASDKIAQLLNLVREKFKAEGVEGKLTKAEEHPSETNQSRFERELIEKMADDREFAQKLEALIDQLKSNEQVNKQIGIKNVKAGNSAELGDVQQEAKANTGSSYQEGVSDVEAGENLKIGNVTQK